MKVRVQSEHSITDELLVKLWRRSSDGEYFGDWMRQPKSDIASNITEKFVWLNWIGTNKGLVPVLDEGNPLDWRFAVELKAAEKESLFVFKESEISVFVYELDKETVHFQLFFENGSPLLTKSVMAEPPAWLAKKIAAVRSERSPELLQSRLSDLTARFKQLTSRRA